MQYREATESDVPALARIRAMEWETEEYWIARISGYRNGTIHPQQALLPRVIYVAVEEDCSIAGFIAGHLTRRFECDGELEWINVIPEHRGAGIALALIQQLAGWFIGQKALQVCVDCDPDNHIAQNFYKRYGAEMLNKHWLVWKDIRVLLSPAG
ncbi:MAG TPA: GNAT family N-acetyltransferase [Puia sp.]|jgi:GNAT superfamily N-acetyltransferase|nr:GNAT family N-acetyltransferase [Puia sp.]